MLLNVILGASGLSSRLFLELREKKGLAYSRQCSLDNKESALKLIESVHSTLEDPALDKATYKEIAKQFHSTSFELGS